MTRPWLALGSLCVLCALLTLGATPASADVRSIPLGQEKSTLTLVEQRDDLLVYEAVVGDLTAIDVATREGDFTRVVIPGFHHSHLEGAPELPMMNRLLAVPYGASVRVEVISQSERIVDLAGHGITNPLFPAQPSMSKSADPATTPFVYDRASYEAVRVAQEPAAVQEVGTLRAVRLARLELSPIEYEPAANRLIVHDRMEVRVHFDGADPVAGARIAASTASPFFEGLYQRIDGYRGQHDLHPDLVRDVVTMAVVVPPQYEAQMQTFLNWKRTRGFNVVVGVIGTPEVGTTAASIQTWLRNLYNGGTLTAPAPSFVLFVGDTDVMPTFIQSSDCTDRPYCCIDADLIPEMYYGRFSCSNPSNLQAMIDKTLMYDQFTMPDPSYLGKVCMIAGVDGTYGQVWANGQINYGTENYFNLAHGISSFTHLYPQSGSQDAQIVQEVSDGVAYVNYTAHGSQTSWSDPTFTQANINGLQNAGEYCMAVGNCCLTSDYDYSSECFAETWLRAANKGAIGYIGGSNSTYWDEDYWWGVGYRASIVEHPPFDPAHMGAYDGMFHDHAEPMTKWYVTNDAYVFCGNLAVTESGSGLITYYWNIYNLMGDPSLSTYLGVPAVNPVSHPGSILVGWSSIDVTATPNSYVGLTMGGTLLGAGTTDAAGNLTLPIWGELIPGTTHLCVTAQNRRPYQADIPVVAPSGPYLIVEATAVSDAALGDNDGECEAGETVGISLTVKNVGIEAATGVSAGITTSDTYSTIGVGTLPSSDIPAGQSVVVEFFTVSFAEATPDNHAAPFDAHFTCAQGSYDDEFSVTVGRPVLAFDSAAISDQPPDGNGSGWIVPGETAGVTVTLANAGHAGAHNAVLTVTDAGIFVEIIQGTGTCTLLPGQGEAAFTPVRLRVLEGCPVPSVITVNASVQADHGLAFNLSFPLSIGGFGDDVEADRGWTLGVAGDNATSGLWVRADPVGTIATNGQVGQPEDDHTPTPGVVCFVTGNGVPGAPAADSDVDGGRTTLQSPTFDLSHVQGATIHYWFWYANNQGNSPNLDYWRVQVSNDGVSWINLEQTTASTNAWTERTYDVDAAVPLTSTVSFRFVAEDLSPGSLVEALVDDFVLTVEEPLPEAVEGPSAPQAWRLAQVAPNPSSRAPVIRFDVPARSAVGLRVFDVSGALVRTLVDRTVEPGAYGQAWDLRNEHGQPCAAGVYFVRLEAAGVRQARTFILIR